MLGLANPLGLLTLASVAVLIVLTQLRRRSRVLTVSSLILWKQFPERPLERQRFRPDLLFALRLLLLLALVGGYALPWIGGPRGGAARRPPPLPLRGARTPRPGAGGPPAGPPAPAPRPT